MDQNQTGDFSITTIPAFTPVPRVQLRHDSWGPDVQRAFIEALADTGSVEAACRFVGKSPASAYRLRRHPEGGEFAHAWQVAVDLGIQQIEDAAMDRARNGVEVPVFAYGDRIATRRVHNDQLVMFMLRNRAPGRYCADGARGMSAIDNRRLKRLKEEWRKEWQEEREALKAKEHGRDTLTETLETMHRNWFGTLSPATRAAYAEFRRLARADRDNGFAWMDEPGCDGQAEGRTIDAQYEEHFGPGQDPRAGIWKVIDSEGVGEADVEDELRRSGGD